MTCNKCTELQAENLQMREALEYYSDPHHYEPVQRMSGLQPPGVLRENGEIAREALKTIAHTKKLADRIKALEEVADKANLCVKDWDLQHEDSSRKLEYLEQALSKLDALEKE